MIKEIIKAFPTRRVVHEIQKLHSLLKSIPDCVGRGHFESYLVLFKELVKRGIDPTKDLGLGSFPVYCAWCLPKKTILGYTTIEHSHGICSVCKQKHFIDKLKGSDINED